MSVIRRVAGWLVGGVADVVDAHPFRVAGGVAALGGLAGSALSLGARLEAGRVVVELTPAALGGLAANHPAYLAAVVVGLALLVAR